MCYGLPRTLAGVGAVDPLSVVDGGEVVEQLLEIGVATGLGRARSQRSGVWWNHSILPGVWGWSGWPFFWAIPDW